MRILLCAATEMEIAPTLQALSLEENHSVHRLITGVGLLACTYALTKELAANRPDIVVQAGVAGSLTAEQPLATVVAVKREFVGDLGVKQNHAFLSIFDLGLLNAHTSPWHDRGLVNESNILKTAGLPLVDGVTVNEISTDENIIRYYRDQVKAQVETMEGAALHYVALLEKIPFLQIRSLSNFIGVRDKAQWKMKEAIANLNHEVNKLLTKLNAT